MSRNSDPHNLVCRTRKSWELRATTSLARLLAGTLVYFLASHHPRGIYAMI